MGERQRRPDMERYFRVTPPSVHQMVLTLEAKGLIDKDSRSETVDPATHPTEELPDLE
jgi:repressor LexA